MPDDATFEPPRDGPAVTREQAIGDGRNVFRENRDEITVGVVRRQRLVEDPRGVPVLRADGEPRVEDRRRRRHQDLQRPAAAALRRRERTLRRGGRDADGGQHLAGKRGRCPRCGTFYVIPNRSTPAPAAAESGITRGSVYGLKTFVGFALPTSNTTYTPNQFFDVCLPHSSRGVVRLVGYLIRKTLGWCDEQGRPRGTQRGRVRRQSR